MARSWLTSRHTPHPVFLFFLFFLFFCFPLLSQRIWRKQIKYDCRKRLADTRPRVKGRFVSRAVEESELLRQGGEGADGGESADGTDGPGGADGAAADDAPACPPSPTSLLRSELPALPPLGQDWGQ